MKMTTARSVTVYLSVRLEDADVLTLPKGDKVIPLALDVTYSSRTGLARWTLVAAKVRKDGTAGNTHRKLSMYAFQYGGSDLTPFTDDTPGWITDLIAEHAPKHYDI